MGLEPITGRARTLMLVLLVTAAMLNTADRGIFSLAMPAIKSEWHFTDRELGLLGGLPFALFYGGAAIPIALLSRRFSLRGALAVCLALWSAATMLTSLAGGFGSLFAARAVVGMGEAGGIPLSLALIAGHYASAERATPTGWVTAGQALGVLLGAWCTGLLISHFGWRQSFLFLGLPGLGLPCLIWLCVAEPPAAATAPPSLRAVFTQFAAPRMRHLTGAFIASGITAYGVQAWLPSLLARHFNLGPTEIGFYSGNVMGFAAIAGALFGGYATHIAGAGRAEFGLKLTAWFSLLALPFGIYACFSAQFTLALLALAFNQAVGGLRISLLYTAAQSFSAPALAAPSIAVLASLTVLIGSGLGPPLVGVISDHASLAWGVAVAMGAALWGAWHCWRGASVAF